MTYEQIEKEFDECWYRDDVKRGLYEGKLDKEYFKSFLKQSFIKYLQSEVERLENSKKEIDNLKFVGSEFDIIMVQRDMGYNECLSDQITHLQAQIKELEV